MRATDILQEIAWVMSSPLNPREGLSLFHDPAPLQGAQGINPLGEHHPKPCLWVCVTQSSDSKSPGRRPVLRVLGPPHLTLLATCTAVEQGVEQQLEGSGGPQVVEQLQDVGLWKQPFAPIEGLQRGSEGQFRALPDSLAPPCPSSGAPAPPGMHSPWPGQQ